MNESMSALLKKIDRLAEEQGKLRMAVDALFENELRKSREQGSIGGRRLELQIKDDGCVNSKFRLVCEKSCVQRCAGFQGCVRCNPVLDQVQDR